MAVNRFYSGQVLGNALSVNGSTTGAKRTLVSSSTGDWSACAWIYLNSSPASTKVIMKNGQTGGGNNGWQFSVNSASRLVLSDPGGVWGGTATTVLSNTTWYHVGFIKSSNTTQMYINGVADGSTIGSTFNSPEGFTSVGCIWNVNNSTYSGIFDGLIDDARFYTRALTEVELRNIYSRETILEPSTSSLQAWYKFDESSEDAADSSGNSRTLTVTNGSYAAGNAYITNVPTRTGTTSRTLAGTRTLAS